MSVVAPTRLVSNPDYPNIVDDYKATLKKLKALPCDIFLAPHGDQFGLAQKSQLLKAGAGSNPFVDAAGWRGKLYGGAMFSPLHANFLINTGEATAADLEGLGEAVRAEVNARFAVDLEWEIKRIGKPA